jgi:O-antigen/teichoic acid export membrane protein
LISRNFVKTSAIYTLAGALPMASGLMLVPFYMVNLSTDNFGALSIYLAFSLLVQLLVTYSFDSSLYIHYHEFKNDSVKLSVFISSAFVLMLLIGLAISILVLPIGGYLVGEIFGKKDIDFFPSGWLALGGGIFQALFKVHSNLLQSREKPETFFWSNLILFTCIFLFTLAGLKLFPQTLIGPLGGRLLALVFASVWVLLRIFREFGCHFDLSLLKTSFSFNFYSFVYQLQQWVINYFDRFLMVFYLPLSSVGIYDFAIKSLVGVELVMNGLHSAIIPKVIKLVYANGQRGTTVEINRYYHGFIATIMIVVCLSIWVVPLAIEWLSLHLDRPAYLLSITIVPYIALLYIARAVRLYFGLPYSILKHTKPLPVIYAIVSVVKIGGMLLLIKELGLMGVVLSTAAGILVEMLMLYFLSNRRFDFKFNFYKILIAPIALVVLIFLSELMLPLNPFVLHICYCMACGLLLLAVYRFEIKTVKLRP